MDGLLAGKVLPLFSFFTVIDRCLCSYAAMDNKLCETQETTTLYSLTCSQMCMDLYVLYVVICCICVDIFHLFLSKSRGVCVCVFLCLGVYHKMVYLTIKTA